VRTAIPWVGSALDPYALVAYALVSVGGLCPRTPWKGGGQQFSAGGHASVAQDTHRPCTMRSGTALQRQ